MTTNTKLSLKILVVILAWLAFFVFLNLYTGCASLMPKAKFFNIEFNNEHYIIDESDIEYGVHRIILHTFSTDSGKINFDTIELYRPANVVIREIDKPEWWDAALTGIEVTK